jgi:hypothetical protein
MQSFHNLPNDKSSYRVATVDIRRTPFPGRTLLNMLQRQ